MDKGTEYVRIIDKKTEDCAPNYLVFTLHDLAGAGYATLSASGTTLYLISKSCTEYVPNFRVRTFIITHQ